MTHNYKLIVSYDGTRYYGWEHQPGQPMTIQGKLETVLGEMAVSEGMAQKITVIGAGRTDAGVHARAMTCNVALETGKTEQEIQRYLNRYLPEDISVNDVKIAADRFHARYKALGKTYRYALWYAEDGSRPVFDRRFVYLPDRRPDVDRMRQAAEYLTGEHDFRSFCGNPHFRKSTIRRVDTIRIDETGHYIRLYYHGSGFLQNMVRIMTGTLLEVGWGKREPEEMPAVLAAQNRQAAGFTAPPQGLCLMKVDY